MSDNVAHVVIDSNDAGASASVEVRRGSEVAAVRVVRGASETPSEYYARLALLSQLSPRQLAGVAHRSTEARRRIAAGASRPGDEQVANAGVFAVETKADAARAEEEARELARRIFDDAD